MEKYLNHLAAGGQSRHTIALRRAQLRRLSAYLPCPLAEASTSLLEGYLGRSDLSNEYRRSLRAAMRGYYGYLQATGARLDNPAAQLPKIKPRPPKPRPTPDLAYQRALKDATDVERLMLRLGAEAGLRRGEVAQVHSRDLLDDLGGTSLLVHGKGGRQRLVPLTDSLAGALRSHFKTHGPGFAFPGKDAGHLSAAYVGKRISRLLPDGVTMHSLRHRFATRVYAASADLLATQQLLGHASPSTTQLYVAVDGARLRSAVEAA